MQSTVAYILLALATFTACTFATRSPKILAGTVNDHRLTLKERLLLNLRMMSSVDLNGWYNDSNYDLDIVKCSLLNPYYNGYFSIDVYENRRYLSLFARMTLMQIAIPLTDIFSPLVYMAHSSCLSLNNMYADLSAEEIVRRSDLAGGAMLASSTACIMLLNRFTKLPWPTIDFVSRVVCDMVSVPIIRSDDLRYGIPVYDEQTGGKERGLSPEAARLAVVRTILSRSMTNFGTTVVPMRIEHVLDKVGLWRLGTGMHNVCREMDRKKLNFVVAMQWYRNLVNYGYGPFSAGFLVLDSFIPRKISVIKIACAILAVSLSQSVFPQVSSFDNGNKFVLYKRGY